MNDNTQLSTINDFVENTENDQLLVEGDFQVLFDNFADNTMNVSLLHYNNFCNNNYCRKNHDNGNNEAIDENTSSNLRTNTFLIDGEESYCTENEHNISSKQAIKHKRNIVYALNALDIHLYNSRKYVEGAYARFLSLTVDFFAEFLDEEFLQNERIWRVDRIVRHFTSGFLTNSSTRMKNNTLINAIANNTNLTKRQNSLFVHYILNNHVNLLNQRHVMRLVVHLLIIASKSDEQNYLVRKIGDSITLAIDNEFFRYIMIGSLKANVQQAVNILFNVFKQNDFLWGGKLHNINSLFTVPYTFVASFARIILSLPTNFDFYKIDYDVRMKIIHDIKTYIQKARQNARSESTCAVALLGRIPC